MLDESRIVTALEAFKAMVASPTDGQAADAWNDAAEALTESEKIELNERIAKL